jgi:hypothetical protein
MSVPLTLPGLLERGPSHGYDGPGGAAVTANLPAAGEPRTGTIVAAIFPLLARISGPEVARNE